LKAPGQCGLPWGDRGYGGIGPESGKTEKGWKKRYFGTGGGGPGPKGVFEGCFGNGATFGKKRGYGPIFSGREGQS